MSLPDAFTLIPVHGKILKADSTGTPASGTVSFRIEQPLRDTADHVICGPTTITGTLDATGSFTVSLPATDDPDISPTGWTYAVTVATTAWAERFRLSIPAASSGTLELADLAPAVNPPATVTYVLTSKVGQVGGPAGPLGPDGQIPAEQIPGGGSGGVSLAGDLGGTLAAPQVLTTHLSAPLPLTQGGTGAASAAAARTSLGAVPVDSTLTAVPSAPLIVHRRNFAIDSGTTPNVDEVWANGERVAWRNESGLYRGIPLFPFDAVFRAIMHAAQTGNIIEVQTNDRQKVLFGVNKDGRIVMGNGTTAAGVVMSPVYVAQASDVLPGALPAGLPAGTVVIQLAS